MRLFAAVFLALAITGAAFQAVAQGFPGPASPGMARLYFYRQFDNNQYTIWTAVFLNDAKIGDIAPGTYFYRDVQPGTYKVGVNSEIPYPDEYQTVTVPPNTTLYIQVFYVPGYGAQFNIGPPPMVKFPNVFGNRVIDPATATSAMRGLSPVSP